MTAELYDPSDDSLTETGSMVRDGSPEATQDGHRDGLAVLLADGRVLVAGGIGGFGGNLRYSSWASIYDPKTERWSPAEALPEGHRVQTGYGTENKGIWGVRLQDGRVLMDKGREGVGAGMLLFDPAGGPKGSWQVVDDCPGTGLFCRGMTVLTDGRVLALNNNTASLFYPKELKWKQLATKVPLSAGYGALLSGSPAQCGPNCGNVLFAETGAELFQLLKVTGLSSSAGLACGGLPLTISGSGLREVVGVNFGAVTVTAINVNEQGTKMDLTTPRHPPGVVPLTVTTRGGATSAPTPDATYTFEPVGPATITGLSPKEGRAGGGTKVDIAGTFAPSCVRAVRFGDQAATDYALDPDQPGTQITATSPVGQPGQEVRVSVDIDPGPPAAADAPIPSVASEPGADVFTYFALPAITALTPPRGPAFGGTSVTITGTGLEGATEVRFGDVRVPPSGFTANSAGTSISVTVPGHDPGAVRVTLTTPKRGDSLVATAPQFTYHPGISGIFPPSGPLTGGTEVTIAGRGFTGAQAVRFGTASVVPISITDTKILVKAPPHGLPEAVPVALTAAGLNSLPENVLFSYGPGDVVDPDPEIDTGTGPPKQDNTPVEPAPPGGSPAASPSNAPSPSASPTPGVATAPGAVPTPGQAPVPGQAPLSAQVPGQSASPSNSPAALPPPIPVASPVAAPGTAAGQSGPGANQGVAGAGDDDDGQGAHRYAMSDARTTLALGAAGATGCFTFLAAARREPARRRRRSGARRPQPKGAY